MHLTSHPKNHALPRTLLTMALFATVVIAFNAAIEIDTVVAGQTTEKAQTGDEPADSDREKVKSDKEARDKKAPASVVEMTIDYGDGAQKRFTAVPWKEGMTVQDALQFAKDHPHGVTFQSRGKGEFGFLSQIDDVKNQAGGGRNWIFYVNQERAEASFAVTTVPKAGAILWRFEEYK